MLKGVCRGEWSQAYWWIQSSGGLDGAHFVLTYLHQNPQSLHVLCCLQVSACLLRGHKNSLQEGFYGDPYFLEFLLLIKREAPGRLLSASVESQMPSSQKNPCAKVSHFGVMYSDPLHLPPK